MRIAKLLTFLTLITFCGAMPVASQADSVFDHWTSGPWQYQAMVSFGNDTLVVDFGENGLWNFNGSWIRLSHWNPENMVSWGEQNLAVDFGAHGLWNYDGISWYRIGSGSL